MCDCQSYNRPENSGSIPETVLDPRPYFAFATKTVCVDACIADQIEALWKAGVFTRGCCCGHNLQGPEVFIDQPSEVEMACSVLAYEKRQWKVMVFAGAEIEAQRRAAQ